MLNLKRQLIKIEVSSELTSPTRQSAEKSTDVVLMKDWVELFSSLVFILPAS
jgi:hypothetical protein